MSKRCAEPQYNDFKKRKTDFYPNSESLPATSKAYIPTSTQNIQDFNEDDIWGDENDEILLLASQAYEQVEQCDMYEIAKYTILIKPSLTSTQKSVIWADQGTSKSTDIAEKFYGTQNRSFNLPANVPDKFKNTASESGVDSIRKMTESNQIQYARDLKSKCNEIDPCNEKNTVSASVRKMTESNLIQYARDLKLKCNEKNTASASGVSSVRKITGSNLIQYARDLKSVCNEIDPIVNERFQHLMKELKMAKVASDKSKHEHEMLTYKYLLKEEEASVWRAKIKYLRSQLDAARLQRLKVEENKQMVWNEKLLALERDNKNLKAQIEFKMDNEVKRHVTDGTDIANMLRLKMNPVRYYPILEAIPKSIFHHVPSKETPIQFSSNKESPFVEHSSFSSIRKRILNEFGGRTCRHLSPEVTESKVNFNFIYEDISKIMEITEQEIHRSNLAINHSLRIFLVVKEYLLKTLKQLKELSAKVTSQTIRETDEKYLNYMAHNPDTLTSRNLFDNSSWCKNEQAIDARILLSVLGVICKHVTAVVDYIFGIRNVEYLETHNTEKLLKSLPLCCECDKDEGKMNGLIGLFTQICKCIGYIGCSYLYPGLLTSISTVLKHCVKSSEHSTDIIKDDIFLLIKELVLLRPNVRVLKDILSILRHLSTNRMFLEILCKNSDSCSLVLDYSQGVALYNSNTCFLQVLCCQVEIWVVNHTEVSHVEGLFHLTRSLVDICHCASHLLVSWASFSQDNTCRCCIRMFRCMMVALHRCARLYKTFSMFLNDENLLKTLNTVLRDALLLLASCNQREPPSGDCLTFLNIISSVAESLELRDEHREALDVLISNISPPLEEFEPPSKEAREIWEESFQNFFITD